MRRRTAFGWPGPGSLGPPMRHGGSVAALLALVALGGCAAPAPVNPAFQRLSAQACALVRRNYPDARIVAHPAHVAASVRMAPSTLVTTPQPSGGYVYVRTYFPQQTGFALEMYLTDSLVLDAPPHPKSWEAYRNTGYTGYAYLAGTRQPVYIYYQTGSSAPRGFN